MFKELCLVGCKQPDYVLMNRVFHSSGLNKCVFKQNSFVNMVKNVWGRVSSASLGSRLWVGWDQGHAGGVEGEGAEKWCMGDARKGMSEDMGVR